METHIAYTDTLHDISDAIIHDVYTGFKEDYLVIHSLIRKYRPHSIFEIGTNVAGGLNVICNAIYKYEPEAKVYSLDLPYETMRQNSKQYPIGTNGEDRVGSAARFPYIQLRGDSMTFDFSRYKCEGFFIDGEHDFDHPFKESMAAQSVNAKIIIFHDADIKEVGSAIHNSINVYGGMKYNLYRVTDTRIAYAVKKNQ